MNPTGKVRSGSPARLWVPYELKKELAVGGMGVIYLAQDLVNNRDVVFKFIAEDLLGDQETKIRFRNEAELTSRLEHPNIVQIYRAGEEDGIFFIIYEFLDGRNLKTLLEMHGAYPMGKALEILIKVCEGIACAHSQKILHRDIKPENILVSPLGDMVKILDFGIAKSIEDAQKLTQTGFIIGTPEYLSPEQAVGHKASFMSGPVRIGGAGLRDPLRPASHRGYEHRGSVHKEDPRGLGAHQRTGPHSSGSAEDHREGHVDGCRATLPIRSRIW